MLKLWVALVLLVSAVWAADPGLERARLLYEKADYAGSLRLLESLKERGAGVWNLLGRNQFMMEDYRKATEAFERATALEPGNSEHWLWLGRSYGRRAELASVFLAPGYASKTRQHLERAVALDGRNIEALNDLFEYYVQAPGFLGGGLEKAQGLVEKIGAVDPVERCWANARLAEERKDYRAAEAQLRRGMELAPRDAGRVVDLAKFLARRGRGQESESVFEQARKLEPNSPVYLWERANFLIEQKREPGEARRLLEQYLSVAVKPEDDHKSEARRLLGRLKGI
ncbi:MAG: tetratricopeptide repeat protein [Acidobacteriota bacterium]